MSQTSTMEEFLFNIAKKIRPELENLSGEERRLGVFDVIGFLYSTPLAVVGLVWLIAVSDLSVVRSHWLMLCLIFLLQYIFERLDFFIDVEVTPGTYSDWQSSLGTVIVWSGVLLFGPTALWVFVLWWLIWLGQRWIGDSSLASRWNTIRNFTFNTACVTLAALVALTLYKSWLGKDLLSSIFPLPGLTFDVMLPALGATLVWWFLSTLIWLPLFVSYAVSKRLKGKSLSTFTRYWGITTGSHLFVDPFAVLAAGLYTQFGLGIYLYFTAGLLLASFAAHELSKAVKSSQQRTRELEQLEQLGRAILTCCPDGSDLPEALSEHVPYMFPNSQIEIHYIHNSISGDPTILRYPENGLPVDNSAWDWLHTQSEGSYFRVGSILPWGVEPTDFDVLMTPILDIETSGVTGGIYMALSRKTDESGSLLPALQTLAAQIASALNSAKTYTQTLAHQRMEHELQLAGEIQTGILPESPPLIKGWQITATIDPARETSGDFYDFIPLPNGLWGILIADVSDKGVGAAMFMALSRTLIRTFAVECCTQPELALTAANHRLMLDTHTGMFMTAFYGILDPLSGVFTYCNAGHNPPLFIRNQSAETEIIKLHRTGMALGVLEGDFWESKTIQINTSDVLLLYTDGITEAQNESQDLFGEQRLLNGLRTSVGFTAQSIQDNLLEDVNKFVGDAPQADDITLMVLVRDTNIDA